jgi:hypothetical protein
MNEDDMNNYLAEGADDDANPCPAQHQCNVPRKGRTGLIVDFPVDRNDPILQFSEI